MGTIVIVVIIVVLLAAAGGAALVLARRRKKQQELQEQFGPEYERRVAETGDRKQAEQELRARKDRHDQLELRPLEVGERERFQQDWKQVQRGFVDDPGGSVEHADALVVTIMRQRGYPVENGEQRADDLSVAHPHVVEHYRVARRIAAAHRNGQASTEDLREAVTSFRSLIESLLEPREGDPERRDDKRPDGRVTERVGSADGAGGRYDQETERIGPAAGSSRGDEGTERIAPDRRDGRPGGVDPGASTERLGRNDSGHDDGRRR